jgi:hypothetical protein
MEDAVHQQQDAPPLLEQILEKTFERLIQDYSVPSDMVAALRTLAESGGLSKPQKIMDILKRPPRQADEAT